MLNFDTKTTKRDGANRFLSPTKKQKMNNVIDLVVRLMNPNTIGFFFQKKNGCAAYSHPLNKAVEDSKPWTEELKINMIVRRVEEGTLHVPKKQRPNTNYNWYMYLRVLDEEELKDVHQVAEDWGKVLEQVLNKQMPRLPGMNAFGLDRYDFTQVEDGVTSIGKQIVQKDVITICEYLYSEAIADKTFFEDETMMEAVFPGVDNPGRLFAYGM